MNNKLKSISQSVIIKDIMNKKFITINADETCFDAFNVLNKQEFSTLVVADGKKTLGIITEKILIRETVLKNKSPKSTKVSSIVMTDFKTVLSTASIHEVRRYMDSNQIKKLIVVDKNQKTIGIVTRKDIRKAFNDIFRSYMHILWNPTFFVIITIVFMLLYLIKTIILR